MNKTKLINDLNAKYNITTLVAETMLNCNGKTQVYSLRLSETDNSKTFYIFSYESDHPAFVQVLKFKEFVTKYLDKNKTMFRVCMKLYKCCVKYVKQLKQKQR